MGKTTMYNIIATKITTTSFMMTVFRPLPPQFLSAVPEKERKSIYAAPFYILCIPKSAQAWITQFYLQIRHACLSFVSVHQMALPLTELTDIQLQLTTHLSTPKG